MLKVICIDATRGYHSGEMPPFKEGEILEVSQSPFHPADYVVVKYSKSCGWHKKRFVPLSQIDETTFERNYNNQTV